MPHADLQHRRDSGGLQPHHRRRSTPSATPTTASNLSHDHLQTRPLGLFRRSLVRHCWAWSLGPEQPCQLALSYPTPDRCLSLSAMMDDYVSESDSDYTSYWRDWFISSRGNEYFCEIDEDYLTDRFNLTGLNTEVQYYQYALDLVTDVFDLDCDDEMRETIEKSARHLYGLVHARYIVTTRGLTKMLDKYKKADFGKCPRVQCHSHPLLPMGLSDVPNLKPVKLYCGRCEDIYNPKSSRHAAIDGAYFGTSFHNILFQVYPALIPTKSVNRYIPRVYGFKVHASAALIRWQNANRDDMRRRLRKLEIDTGFREELGEDEEDEDEVEFEGIDGRMAVVEGL
ncbi:Casein kinase II subunit beta-2 [Neonectria ditissima]|uniref:Casein kinase II subunit beta n=1 Tax=Neonectria ditissima TaxID=78410 RepID=A0A0P7B151_9HYPO|nr:Casein kinase II subunit beta-2 [Neonectria ditissima]